VADAIIGWLRENPSLVPTSQKDKIFDKYQIDIPYMSMFYGREMAFDRIIGPWNESFQLLYTFKAEVGVAPISVVELNKHTLQYKVKREHDGEGIL
jgi:hypothetical protein